jgi:hypothetical protein
MNEWKQGNITAGISMLRLVVTANVVPRLLICVALMMDVICSYETSVLTRATWCNIPEYGLLNSHRHENFKPYMGFSCFAMKHIWNTGDSNYCWRTLSSGMLMTLSVIDAFWDFIPCIWYKVSEGIYTGDNFQSSSSSSLFFLLFWVIGYQFVMYFIFIKYWYKLCVLLFLLLQSVWRFPCCSLSRVRLCWIWTPCTPLNLTPILSAELHRPNDWNGSYAAAISTWSVG